MVEQNVPISPNSFLSGNYVNTMFFEPSAEQEITEIVYSFTNGVAAGYDNLSVSAIKESIELIASPLTHIVNLSISSGIFPDPLKIARVVPIFKSGDHRMFVNYRPVSILPIYSKIFERVIFCFRKNHSTSLALLQLYA